MASEMTEEEIETYLAGSRKIDDYDYRAGGDDDDYVVAALYETNDGRMFRYVESSGYNTSFSGAGNFGEWLEGGEIATWKSFYP